MINQIYLIELFAGIGSQAKALKNIGLNIIHHKVIEFDKYAIASYNAVHDTNFKPTDITTIKGDDLKITNTQFYTYLMTYSFPCQDLSLAGKGAGMTKGNSTRSGLLWEVERLLNECKELPQYLLLENVPQIHSKKNIDDFKLWQKFLEEKGYNNYWQDLNAKNYGIPQNRNRTFMVSIRKDVDLGYDFPQPFELKLRLKDMLEQDVDEKYFLSDKLINSIVNCENKQEKQNYCLKINEKTKKGYAKATENDGVYINRPHQKRGCVQKDMIQTIKTSPNDVGVVVKDLRIRKLTPKECWRLMGFSDIDFDRAEKINSNAQLYKQAGNSIVVNVLEHIFKELFKERKEKKQRKERYEKMSIFDFIGE